MRYLSLFSGIEAASLAWQPLGWEPMAFSEIDPFCCELLRQRFPTVPNLGDVTASDFVDRAKALRPIDLIVGGSPCQSFSLAGLRGGLHDDRGNLTLRFVEVVHGIDPEWVVWENVPGVLSHRDNPFGCFLAGMVGADAALVPPGRDTGVADRKAGAATGRWTGAGFVDGPRRTAAFRILDAQWLGVAQRRRRVFVVSGRAGDARCGPLLLESPGLRRDPPTRRAKGEGTAGYAASSLGASGRRVARTGETRGQDPVVACFGGNRTSGEVDVATACNAHGGTGRHDFESETFVAHSLRADGFDASEDGTGRRTPLVPVCFSSKDHGADAGEIAPTLRAAGHDGSHANAGAPPAICQAFYLTESRCDNIPPPGVSPPLKVGSSGGCGKPPAVAVSLRGRDGGGTAELGGEQSCAVRASQGGGDKPHVLCGRGNDDGHAEEAGPVEALRMLREAVGEEAFCLWCLGILAAFWPKEVLRSAMHGSGIRCPSVPQRGLLNVALARSQVGSAWSVRDLWEAGCDGCPPQGSESYEQLAGQLGAYLSELPHAPAPSERLLRCLWRSCEGSRLLRETLSAVEEARRSECIGMAQEETVRRVRSAGEREGTVRQALHAGQASAYVVRRLVPEETEALQGMPRGWTLITVRGKPAADGPRYKSIGNSFAVPVVRWIGERIASCIQTKPDLPADVKEALARLFE